MLSTARAETPGQSPIQQGAVRAPRLPVLPRLRKSLCSGESGDGAGRARGRRSRARYPDDTAPQPQGGKQLGKAAGTAPRKGSGERKRAPLRPVRRPNFVFPWTPPSKASGRARAQPSPGARRLVLPITSCARLPLAPPHPLAEARGAQRTRSGSCTKHIRPLRPS